MATGGGKWRVNRAGPQWLMDAEQRVVGYKDIRGKTYTLPQELVLDESALPQETLETSIVKMLSASGVPMVRPPAGSMAANGAVTFGTAFDAAISGYFYYPAGALFTGSAAGMYWTAMSSTTVGAVFNNTYLTGEPSAPTTLVPIVAAGPGSFTYPILADVTLWNVSVPAGSMGAKGRVRTHFMYAMRTSANNRGLSVLFGGQGVFSWGGIAAQRSGETIVTVVNSGDATRQCASATNVTNLFTVANQPATFTALDTKSAQIKEFRAQTADAADWIILTSTLCEVLPNG